MSVLDKIGGDGVKREARDPAWGEPSRGEARWPASLAVVAAVVLYLTLPVKLQTFGPEMW